MFSYILDVRDVKWSCFTRFRLQQLLLLLDATMFSVLNRRSLNYPNVSICVDTSDKDVRAIDFTTDVADQHYEGRRIWEGDRIAGLLPPHATNSWPSLHTKFNREDDRLPFTTYLDSLTCDSASRISLMSCEAEIYFGLQLKLQVFVLRAITESSQSYHTQGYKCQKLVDCFTGYVDFPSLCNDTRRSAASSNII